MRDRPRDAICQFVDELEIAATTFEATRDKPLARAAWRESAADPDL